MSIDPEIAGRIQGGRFVPGVSGNPAGKPPGARARATRLAEKMMAGDAEAVLRDTRPGPACMTVQRQAQADRDACDRLLKAIFDRGLGQRQIARVTGIPLSTVQRALQRVIYPYRQDRPTEDAPTWKKRRAKLERVAIDQLRPTREAARRPAARRAILGSRRCTHSIAGSTAHRLRWRLPRGRCVRGLLPGRKKGQVADRLWTVTQPACLPGHRPDRPRGHSTDSSMGLIPAANPLPPIRFPEPPAPFALHSPERRSGLQLLM